MANEQNLKPVRSKKEARERGKKGGIASVKARKKKKDLKERIEIAFDIMTKKRVAEEKDEIVKQVIAETGVDVYTALEILNNKKAFNGEKIASLKLLWSYKHGMPLQEVKQDTTIREKKTALAAFPDESEILKHNEQSNKSKLQPASSELQEPKD